MAVEKAPVWTFPTNPKRLGRWYGKGPADRSPVGPSVSLRSLARNHAPSPVLESTLLVLVILNAISSESPSILSACLTSSRSPSLSPDFTSYFSRCRPGVMSGVRVHTTLDSRPLSLKCSVNRFSTRPAVLMRLHWIYAVQSFSCSTSADTSARYASVAVMTAVPSL